MIGKWWSGMWSAPMWVRVAIVGVSGFLWGFTGWSAFGVIIAVGLVWLVHGGLRRARGDGRARSTGRRIMSTIAVAVGIVPLLVMTTGPGATLREAIDPAFTGRQAGETVADATARGGEQVDPSDVNPENAVELLAAGGVQCDTNGLITPPDGSRRIICNLVDGNWGPDSFELYWDLDFTAPCEAASEGDPMLGEPIVDGGGAWIAGAGRVVDAFNEFPSRDLAPVAAALGGTLTTVGGLCGRE